MSNNRNRKRRTGNTGVAREMATAGDAFVFNHNGRTYTLPSAKGAAGEMTGGDLIDAAMDESEAAQLRFGIKMLQAAGPSTDAMAALRAMPIAEFTHVINAWFRAGQVSLGKSGSSSA